MSSDHTPQGTVASGFESVRHEFAAVAAHEGRDYAAQLVAYAGAQRVVDLWVGPEITADSLFGVFSSTKGAAHLVVALLVQDGVLDLDRKVSHYWREFAAEGKQDITLRDLLAHRAGLVGADAGFLLEELADDRVIADRLAGQRPYWRPGSQFGYHALVIGALTGEIVRRVTGKTIQGPTDEQQAQLDSQALGRDSLVGIAYNRNSPKPADLQELPNLRMIRAKGQASVGGVASARGLAKMYAASISSLDGTAPLLKPDTAAQFAQVHSAGFDLVARKHKVFGLGFTAVDDVYPELGQGAFGHSGAAGSMALADPRSGLAYGYNRRRFAFPGGAAPENDRLVRAIHAAIVEYT